jgi:hypothetical protein
MEKHGGKLVVADIWPFLPTMLESSVDSAWPHNGKEPNGPLLVHFMWEDMTNDSVWIGQLKTALRRIHEIALQEKCTTDDAPLYYNTTLKLGVEDFPSPEQCERWHCEQIYRHNLADLSALRTKYDPDNVMGRTGGFRIPLDRAIVDGVYKITNTKDNYAIVGVKESSEDVIPVVKSDGTIADRFKISSGDETAYTISIDNPNHADNRVAQDNTGNVVRKRQGSTDTWKIIPESRRKNQLEYS